MTDDKEQKAPDALVNPISELPGYDDTESKIGIFGHPLHAMAVAFPVALTFCCFGADGLYWLSGDPFWALAAIWAAGTAFLFGLLAGLTGIAEMALVRGMRMRPPVWTHFLIAVFLLSSLGANWGHRLDGWETAALPYGILLSGFNVILVIATGWHGGALVFSYRLGTSKGS